MKREIRISGTYKRDNENHPFTGVITFDEREDSIYYSWELISEDGSSIAGKSLRVSFHQIPVGQDRVAFSKQHALEGIKKCRIGREKIVQELIVCS